MRVINPDFLTSYNYHIIKGHESPVIAIDVDESGNYIISADKKGTIIIWDVKTSKILER